MLVWRGLKPSRTLLALRALLEPERDGAPVASMAAPEPPAPPPVSSLRLPPQG